MVDLSRYKGYLPIADIYQRFSHGDTPAKIAAGLNNTKGLQTSAELVKFALRRIGAIGPSTARPATVGRAQRDGVRANAVWPGAAIARLCPMSFAHSDRGMNCKAEECMAWTWVNADLGYCGLTRKVEP